MALFDSNDPSYTDLDWFEDNENQPPAPRHSVLYIRPQALASDQPVGGWVEKYDNRPESEWPQVDNEIMLGVTALLQQYPRDWTRIHAVLIDEPFWKAARDVQSSNPCSGTSNEDQEGYRRMITMQRVLVNVAAVVRGMPNAGKTRVWVNFSGPEMEWMRREENLQLTPCPVRLNDWYMDVVSLDIYGADFASILDHYNYLYDQRATPYQQLALIPGTYSASLPGYDGDTVAGRLQGFFDYAETMNHSCSFPIGRVGITKSADGCPIWLVAGFSAKPNMNDGRDSIFHHNSVAIRDKWLARFQLPRWDDLFGRVEVFDIPNGVISGWAVDRTLPDAPPAVDVWLFSLDTQNPEPPIYLGGTAPTQQRSDVETGTGISLAGYTFTIPNEHRQVVGCHEYTVYAVARPPGVGNAVLGSKKVQCP